MIHWMICCSSYLIVYTTRVLCYDVVFAGGVSLYFVVSHLFIYLFIYYSVNLLCLRIYMVF